jgi:hypothetical protein
MMRNLVAICFVTHKQMRNASRMSSRNFLSVCACYKLLLWSVPMWWAKKKNCLKLYSFLPLFHENECCPSPQLSRRLVSIFMSRWLLTSAWFSAIVFPFSTLTIFTFLSSPQCPFTVNKTKQKKKTQSNKKEKKCIHSCKWKYVSNVCTVMILHVLISWTRKEDMSKMNPKFSVSGKPIYTCCCVVS